MTHRRQLILAEAQGNVSALRTARTNSDPGTRALALGSLDRLGELSSDHILAALADDDRNVRIRAIELAESRPDISLVAGLQDSDDLVVETTAWALGELSLIHI